MAFRKDKHYIDFVLHCYLCRGAEYLAWKFMLGEKSGEVVTPNRAVSYT